MLAVNEERWDIEARRLYRRYATEVVERFCLCPWAERARAEGHVSEHVLLCEKTADFSDVLALVQQLATRREIEVAVLIFPRLELPRPDFERFVSALSRRDAAQYELGAVPFAMAAFHPLAPAHLEDPERLISFIRRSPDPLIQLIRHEVLASVRRDLGGGTEFVSLEHLSLEALTSAPRLSLRERVAESNLRTIKDFGIERMQAILDDIRADRDRTYAKLRAE